MLIDSEAVIKTVDRHTRDDGTLDEDISIIVEGLPSADASLMQDRRKIDASSDVINRQDAIDAITLKLDMIDHVPYWVFDQLTDALKRLPSAERKGEWIVENGEVVCSECGEPNRETDYCPFCGAHMER